MNDWLRHRIAQALMLAVAVGGSVNADVTFTDDFNDGVLNLCDWQLGGLVDEVGGTVNLDSPDGAYAHISPRFEFVGDLDLRIDFNLLQFPAVTRCHASFVLLGETGGDEFVVSVKRLRREDGNEYQFHLYDPQTGHSIVHWSVPTADMSGRFRISRVGTQYTGYYWAMDWIALGSFSWAASPVECRAQCFSDGDGPTLEVRYDNFVAVADDAIPIVESSAFADNWPRCMNGPDEPIDYTCDCTDMDGDGDADLADFAEFQRTVGN